ncbi:MAG: glycoside hydrolase family 5 protein [Lachnospiraceae bacterium]|nr:glycoside hydrolase family 5 protein [Lachnospiraceae bacterium]
MLVLSIVACGREAKATENNPSDTIVGADVDTNDSDDSKNSDDNTDSDKTDEDNNDEDDNIDGTGEYDPNKTFVENHGALKVDGANLVDKNGNKVQLYGMSTHGIAWFPDYVNYDTFKYLRDEWGNNCIRLAMYTEEYAGYTSGGDKNKLKELVSNGVDYATDLGMYVIIDWHILNDQTPMRHKDEAKDFFDEMSKKYKDYDNVIYEICNEPNGQGTWDEITRYANEVIPVIRANDPDAIILVGTPTWSQEVDKPAASPLNFDNVMYVLHFYAATHTDWLRQRMQEAINAGTPIFISEFGLCEASGNGAINKGESDKWKKIIEDNNISFMCWNLANKDETSSIIKSGCNKLSGWSDNELKEEGLYMKDWFKSKMGN